jgi:hypothetical protein
MVWSWQPGADDDVHGFTVAAGRPVWVHVWRSLDTGAFDFDGEVLGMGGEMVPAQVHRSDDWSRDAAQEAAERAVADWARAEDARRAGQQLDDERWYESEDGAAWSAAVREVAS